MGLERRNTHATRIRWILNLLEFLPSADQEIIDRGDSAEIGVIVDLVFFVLLLAAWHGQTLSVSEDDHYQDDCQ